MRTMNESYLRYSSFMNGDVVSKIAINDPVFLNIHITTAIYSRFS